MTSTLRVTALVACVASVACVAFWATRAGRREPLSNTDVVTARATSTDSRTQDEARTTETPPNEALVDVMTPSRKNEGAVLVRATWGSARGQLGRDRPHEGNPEGPMSLAFAGKDLLVLDQVNGRLVRYDANGAIVSDANVPTTAQDIALAADGTIAVIDRLVGKAVTLVDPNGRKLGELPLAPRVAEPGLVTALVVDGKNVYAEKEHGALILLGTTQGTQASETGELTGLSGRPTRDGALLVTAGFASKPRGDVFLNAMDRKSAASRFARQIRFPRPAQALVLLDSDAKGTIYLGVAAGEPPQAHVVCMDPSDGHVLGRVELPLSDTPEESFRDFTVRDDGTLAVAVRTEQGVEYRLATCP